MLLTVCPRNPFWPLAPAVPVLPPGPNRPGLPDDPRVPGSPCKIIIIVEFPTLNETFNILLADFITIGTGLVVGFMNYITTYYSSLVT